MKKVAIVCGSPSSEMLAPFDNAEYETWALGNRINNFKGKRVTRIFEIHDNLTQHGDVDKYAQYLVNIGIPMVVGEKFPIHASHVLPFDYAASEKLYGSLYLTSSPAYMMSQAISEGFGTIAIYGVDLAITNHEYFWQRPCMEAWVGFAKGRGIKIEMPDVCPVGHSAYVEGRDWDGIKNNYKSKTLFCQAEFEKLAEIQSKRTQEIDEQIKALSIKANAHAGAEQAYLHMAKVARAVEAGNDIKSLTDTMK
jgi:hypothetical protein